MKANEKVTTTEVQLQQSTTTLQQYEAEKTGMQKQVRLCINSPFEITSAVYRSARASQERVRHCTISAGTTAQGTRRGACAIASAQGSGKLSEHLLKVLRIFPGHAFAAGRERCAGSYR